MGGNAIKKNGISICERLIKTQYEQIKKNTLNILSFVGLIAKNIIELPDKESFGDLDILYIINPEIDIINVIKNKFNVSNPDYIVINGYVISFAYEYTNDAYFQIDFIGTRSEEHLNISSFYFSYADLGSIIGRLCNYYGMKFGDNGLWCNVYESTAFDEKEFDIRNIIGKIYLSSDPRAICEFLGLDYQYWETEMPKLKKNRI